MRRIFLNSKELLKLIAAAIDEKHGEDIIVYDMQGISILSDYVIITHGNSNSQVHAIADNVSEKLKEADYYNFNVEGNKDSDWLLIDAKEVLVNVFTDEAREFYGLEKLWSEAKEIPVEELLQ